MKLRRLLLMTGIVLVGQVALCGEARVAVIDMDYVLRQFHKSRRAEAEIDRQKGEFIAEIEQMRAKLTEMEGLFKKARQAAREKGLDDDELKARLELSERRLMDVKEWEQRIHEFAQKRKAELVAQSERMRKTLLDDIRQAVRTYAKNSGLLVVVDVNAGAQAGIPGIVYRDKSVDITEKVIKVLNGGKDGGQKGGKQ